MGEITQLTKDRYDHVHGHPSTVGMCGLGTQGEHVESSFHEIVPDLWVYYFEIQDQLLDFLLISTGVWSFL